ncbi:MAG: hypothetical protein ACT4ON_11215 [Bacteroidota bacterium]
MRSIYNYLCIACLFTALNTFGRSEIEKEIEKFSSSVVIDRIGNDDIEVSVPSVIFTFKDTKIKLKFKNPDHTKLLLNNNKLHFIINGDDVELTFTNGEATLLYRFNDNTPLSIYIEEFSYNQNITAYPLWALLLPIAILLLWLISKKNKRKKTSPF